MATSHSTTPLFVQLPYQPPTITADHILCQTTIAGNPVTKARARFYADKVYTPKKTRLAEQALQWALKAACAHEEPNRVDDLGLSAIFYTRTKQRCDVDNFLKLLMDACTGIIWGDDLQVTEVSGKVVRGDEHPRIDVLIYRLPAAPVPVCETCQGPLPQRGKIVKRTNPGRYCSKACYDVAQQKGRYVACATCGARLYRTNEKLHQAHWYCSPRCRVLAYAEKKLCKQCGQAFTRSRSVSLRQSFCSSTCRQAWHDHREGPPSQCAGTCPDCGSPSRIRNGTSGRCHPCHLTHRYGTTMRRFTQTDRQQLQACLDEGLSQRLIAKRLGISRYMIAREIAFLRQPHDPEQLVLLSAS